MYFNKRIELDIGCKIIFMSYQIESSNSSNILLN